MIRKPGHETKNHGLEKNNLNISGLIENTGFQERQKNGFDTGLSNSCLVKSTNIIYIKSLFLYKSTRSL